MAHTRLSDDHPTTVDTGFREIPTEGMRLLAVSAGLDSRTAIREASDLEDAVRRVLAESIETGAPGSTAYLCEFALEVAKALRDAVSG
jgi:hypothetical protein